MRKRWSSYRIAEWRSNSALQRILALTLTSFLLTTPVSADRCKLNPADRKWIESALSSWTRVERVDLKLPRAPLPTIVLFDKSCVRTINSPASMRSGRKERVFLQGGSIEIRSSLHNGTIRLPDNVELPPRVTSFASTYGTGQPKPFLVMALPDVWREDQRHRDNPELDLLTHAVFIHEMTHTRQTSVLGRKIGELGVALGVNDAEIDDDIVQTRFADKPGFREAYEKERDLLFEAASADNDGERAALAADAVAGIKERRARHFTGADARYAELEDVFLDMEGLANWAAFRAVVAKGKSKNEAIASIRRARKWSQDEGLALFLAVDALTPGWQQKIFAPVPILAVTLLQAALPGNR